MTVAFAGEEWEELRAGEVPDGVDVLSFYSAVIGVTRFWVPVNR